MRTFLTFLLAVCSPLLYAAEDVTNFTATVTAQRVGEAYFFAREDGSPRSWRVSLKTGDDRRFRPGDRVSVSALLERRENRHTTRVFDAQVERLGKGDGKPPSPRRTTIAELNARRDGQVLPDPDWYADYVCVEGRLVDFYRRTTMTSFVLEDGGGRLQFSAAVPIADKLSADIQIGARIRVTGPAVYSTVRAGGRVAGFENVGIIPDSLGCVEVTSRAPFWTVGRVLVLVGVLVSVLAASLVWVALLRRTVAKMEQSIREKVRDRVAAEATRRERLRLSHDLHDDFQQLLASSTFRLAAAQNFLRNGAERGEVLEQLNKVEDSLTHAQTGLRAALWSMSEEAEGPSRLSGLFRYASGRLAQWNGRVSFAFHGEEPSVSSRYAGALLMILQEAVGNALRHGGADRVAVDVVFGAEEMTLSITDDGSGFDISILETVNAGLHLGVSGMRARTAGLGGRFAITSAIGRGTVITLTVPLKT